MLDSPFFADPLAGRTPGEGLPPSFFPPHRPKEPEPAALAKAYGLDKVAYPVNEAMRLLSISRSTFYGLAKEGRLKVVKVGRRSIIYATDLAWLLFEMHRDGGIPSKPRKPKTQPGPEPR
jgi:excisionase family DNA binding protein